MWRQKNKNITGVNADMLDTIERCLLILGLQYTNINNMIIIAVKNGIISNTVYNNLNNAISIKTRLYVAL